MLTAVATRRRSERAAPTRRNDDKPKWKLQGGDARDHGQAPRRGFFSPPNLTL